MTWRELLRWINEQKAEILDQACMVYDKSNGEHYFADLITIEDDPLMGGEQSFIEIDSS